MANLVASTSLLLLISSISMADGGIGDLNLIVNPYDPYCAMACLRSIYGLSLSCSTMDSSRLGMMQEQTSSECWATNDPYLTTLAYCINVKCKDDDVPASKLEWFWESEATGQSTAGQVLASPKWTYAEALAQVQTPPTSELSADAEWLNITSLVSEEVYQKQWNVLVAVNEESARENLFGILLLVIGFGLPILLTWINYVPFVSGLFHKLKPLLVWPSTIGGYHVKPLPYLLGNAPTKGQALYITLFVVLNIIFTAVGYRSRQPSAWYANQYYEIMAYIFYRTGALAYIFAPLVFLFAGRNNFLLWSTNWSHSTYVLLHRWISRVFTFQAILHSTLAVILYKDEGSYSSQVPEPYWIWGVVATIAAIILTFGSGLYVRNFAYELFLLTHIVLSVILIAACWYHAYDLYAYLGGYSIWLTCCAAIWVFDRVMRVLRIIAVGLQRAQATSVGEEYVRIDIPGVRWGLEPGKHVYCYFPTLTPWRPWENHPFSIISTPILHQDQTQELESQHGERSTNSDIEKDYKGHVHTVSVDSRSSKSNGITLYIRRSTGFTRYLQASSNLLAFVEGPYPNNHTKAILRCDRLLLISGGIGITGVLPFVHSHWNVKLAWSVKESAIPLVDHLDRALSSVQDKQVTIGSRLDITQLLADEVAAGWERVGVVACGPGSLCDDVRAAVIKASRSSNTQFELEVEAYSW